MHCSGCVQCCPSCQELSDEIGRLSAIIEAAKDCGTNPDNPDTCGVCHKHFHECEEDQHCVDLPGEEHLDLDIPNGREPACPGARVRKALEIIEAYHHEPIA